MATCTFCGKPIRQKRLGRPALYCSGRCRVAAFRERRALIVWASWCEAQGERGKSEPRLADKRR